MTTVKRGDAIEPTRVYDSNEAAILLNVSRSTVQRWMKARRIMTTLGTRNYRATGESLLAFVNGNRELHYRAQERWAA